MTIEKIKNDGRLLFSKRARKISYIGETLNRPRPSQPQPALF